MSQCMYVCMYVCIYDYIASVIQAPQPSTAQDVPRMLAYVLAALTEPASEQVCLQREPRMRCTLVARLCNDT